MKDNRCVCCGAVIPEGRQICYSCSLGKFKRFGSMFTVAGLMLSLANPTPVKAIQHDMGTLMKDVNYDGVIDSRDATLVLGEYARISAGLEPTFTRTQRYIADNNYDGKIDAVDASHILSTYAINSSGKFVPYKTVTFGAKSVGEEPLMYQAYSIEEVEHYINSNYPTEMQFEIVANTTVWMENSSRNITYIVEE